MIGPRAASVYTTDLARSMTMDQAAASLAATISRGGAAGLLSGYNDGYSYGGPSGTVGGINDVYRNADQRSLQNALAKATKEEMAQEQRDQEGMLTSPGNTLKSTVGFLSGLLGAVDPNPSTPSNIDEAFGPGGTHQPGSYANPYAAEQWAQSRGGTYQAESDMSRALGKIAPSLAGMGKLQQAAISAFAKGTDTTPMGSFTDQYGESFGVNVGGGLTSLGPDQSWTGSSRPELEPTPTPIAPGPSVVNSNTFSKSNVPTSRANVDTNPVSDPTDSSGSQNLTGQGSANTMGSTQSPSSIPGSSQDPDLNDGGGEDEAKPLNNSEIPSYGLNTRVATTPASNIYLPEDSGEDSEATTGLSAMQKTLGPQVRTLINAGYSAEDAIQYLGISNSSLTTAEILKELNLG